MVIPAWCNVIVGVFLVGAMLSVWCLFFGFIWRILMGEKDKYFYWFANVIMFFCMAILGGVLFKIIGFDVAEGFSALVTSVGVGRVLSYFRKK